jgi:O-antigen/teichoic acid export membrane protein
VVSLSAFVILYHFNLFPSVARTIAAPRSAFTELMAHSFRVAAWASVWGAMLVSLLAEPLCRVAFGEDLASAGPILSIAIWLVPISLLSGHARWALIAYGHQSRELAAEVAAAVTLITVGSILTAHLGAMGAALGVLVAAAVVWAVAHRYASQRVGKLPSFRPAVLPLSMAALAIGVARWALPQSPWIGGAVAACVMLVGGVVVEPRLLRDLESLARAVTLGGSEPTTTGSPPLD